MFSLLGHAVKQVKTLVLGTEEEDVLVAGRHLRLYRKIAEGGYALVYEARQMSEGEGEGEVFAVKRLLCHDVESTNNAEAEAMLLQSLPPHPNVIRFLGAAKHKVNRNGQRVAEYLILTSLYTGGGLHDALQMHREDHDGAGPSELCIFQLFAQACAAVAHLHAQEPPIAHRDVKLENMLLGGSLEECASGGRPMVLCDFGSATTRAGVYRTRKDVMDEEDRIQRYTTMAYRSPEMVDLYQYKRIDEKVDVWALGVLLYLMAYNKFPFDPESPLGIINGKYTVPPAGDEGLFSSKMASLVRMALTTDVEKRPPVKDLHRNVIDAIDDILFENDPFSTEFRGMHAQVEHHESAQGDASHLFQDVKCAPASDGEWAGGFGEFGGLKEDDVGVVGGASVCKEGGGGRGLVGVHVDAGTAEEEDKRKGWVQFGSETSAGDEDGHVDRVQDAGLRDEHEDNSERDAAVEHAGVKGGVYGAGQGSLEEGQIREDQVKGEKEEEEGEDGGGGGGEKKDEGVEGEGEEKEREKDDDVDQE